MSAALAALNFSDASIRLLKLTKQIGRYKGKYCASLTSYSQVKDGEKKLGSRCMGSPMALKKKKIITILNEYKFKKEGKLSAALAALNALSSRRPMEVLTSHQGRTRRYIGEGTKVYQHLEESDDEVESKNKMKLLGAKGGAWDKPRWFL